MSSEAEFAFDRDPVANPYAPTTEVSPQTLATDDVEAYRRTYLKHEASVKAIGTLYWLGAVFTVPLGLFLILVPILAVNQGGGGESSIFAIGLGGFYVALGVLYAAVGQGLRRLRPWSRIIAIIFSFLGLLAIPVGTLISAYFLYLLLSEKGQIVFSPTYQDVIAKTPHIKYKTSWVVWTLLIVLIVVLVLGLGMALTLGG